MVSQNSASRSVAQWTQTTHSSSVMSLRMRLLALPGSPSLPLASDVNEIESESDSDSEREIDEDHCLWESRPPLPPIYRCFPSPRRACRLCRRCLRIFRCLHSHRGACHHHHHHRLCQRPTFPYFLVCFVMDLDSIHIFILENLTSMEYNRVYDNPYPYSPHNSPHNIVRVSGS